MRETWPLFASYYLKATE